MVKLNCSKLQMTCQNHNKTSVFLFIKVILKSKIKNKEDIIGLIWTDGMVLKMKIQLLHSEFVSWLYNQGEKNTLEKRINCTFKIKRLNLKLS